jgi:hypothetical protein
MIRRTKVPERTFCPGTGAEVKGPYDMTGENPFEVLLDRPQATELPTLQQYGPVSRLRFFGWSIGLLSLTMLLFIAMLRFTGGLAMLTVPVLVGGWYATQTWLIRARLRNVGCQQWWLLIPPILLFASWIAAIITSSNNALALAAALAQITSLLALLNLPILVICLAMPTGFAERRKTDMPATIVLIAGVSVAVVFAVVVLGGLLG